jgi:hypothetical protein
MSDTAIELRNLNREYARIATQYRLGNITNSQLLREQVRIRREKDEIERAACEVPAGAAGDWWGL